MTITGLCLPENASQIRLDLRTYYKYKTANENSYVTVIVLCRFSHTGNSFKWRFSGGSMLARFICLSREVSVSLYFILSLALVYLSAV